MKTKINWFGLCHELFCFKFVTCHDKNDFVLHLPRSFWMPFLGVLSLGPDGLVDCLQLQLRLTILGSVILGLCWLCLASLGFFQHCHDLQSWRSVLGVTTLGILVTSSWVASVLTVLECSTILVVMLWVAWGALVFAVLECSLVAHRG